MSKSAIFVYGSLMKGMVHHSKVASFVKESHQASTTGVLYRLPSGYPAMVEGDGTVRGELLELDNFSEIIKLLDEFEGFSQTNPAKSLHMRAEKQVVVDGSSDPIVAYTYLLNEKKLPKDAQRIDSGDGHENFKANPPLEASLSESQKKYIIKLGGSSGRDIVPINLDIYRDLLNRGLIIDKGRRLALTSLGAEVFRYLS